MTYFVICLITAVNCIVLFFASLLAVSGDGRADGIHRIWFLGYPWIAFFTICSLAQCARGNQSRAVEVVSSTLPLGFATAIALILLNALLTSTIDRFKPASPELEVACKSAGPRYIQKPMLPVESIAYDWEPGTNPPYINYFEINDRLNVKGLRGGLARFPPPIKFTERRCCQFEGLPSNGIGPFVHHPGAGAYFGTTKLTADILVKYKVLYVTQVNSKNALKTVDLTVTDRRDGQKLATLRYVLDERGRQGCGEVSKGVMDEQEFIRRAVGIN